MTSKVFFLTALYKREPNLGVKKQDQKEVEEITSRASPILKRQIYSVLPMKKNCCSRMGKAAASIPQVMVIYYRQTIFLAALGMALLFMTVLGFDGVRNNLKDKLAPFSVSRRLQSVHWPAGSFARRI